MLKILIFSLLLFSVCFSFPADENLLKISENIKQEDESQADKREIYNHEKSAEELLQTSEADLENRKDKREEPRRMSKRETSESKETTLTLLAW